MKYRHVLAIPFVALLVILPGALAKLWSVSVTEALTGFTTTTYSEDAPESTLNTIVSNGFSDSQTFLNDQSVFQEEDGVDKGLGPTFNARACVDCHQNPVTGGASQVSVRRVGHMSGGQFVNPNITINDGQTVIASRSLVNDRAICPQAQERVPQSENIRTFRMSLNTLGDGYVESIADSTLQALAQQQRALTRGRIAGEAIQVPIAENPGQTRVGRFGWKDQQASLLSFASDAYLNEQGITNRLNPNDVTTLCQTTTGVEDGPDSNGLDDIDHQAHFMRGTMAPPVDSNLMGTADAQAGQQIFMQIGCAFCHTTSITTAAPGTVLVNAAGNNGFTVPDALGNKIIHPFSDFLLHDVGTGDGIVQNGPPDTANKLRTPPLWGLRTHNRYMHDGLSATVQNAIQRHDGEADFVTRRFQGLTQRQKNQLVTFLNSL